jgi:hypothetical protein
MSRTMGKVLVLRVARLAIIDNMLRKLRWNCTVVEIRFGWPDLDLAVAFNFGPTHKFSQVQPHLNRRLILALPGTYE